MKIRFRRKTKTEWLCLFILCMPFCFFLLLDLLQLPDLVKYTVDLAWIFLLLAMVFSHITLPNSQTKQLLTIIGIFFGLSVFVYLLNYQSLLFYFWGLRNNIRFFVFFFACVLYIRERSVENYLRFFDLLFWINFFVVLYQFLFLGQNQDHLGGLFGMEKGCNGYTNVFLMIATTISILSYMNHREGLFQCLLKLGAALLIAILSELKIFIVELIIIAALAAVIAKFSLRKLGIILAIIIGALIAGNLIAILFPVFSEWFSVERMWRNVTSNKGYTASDDMNRFTAVSIALARFLPSWWNKLFGLGLGNCDYAGFSFLMTPFFRTYGWMNYTWFSSAFLILETGIVGLVLYCLFFAFVFLEASKMEREKPARQLQCQMARVLSIMCLLLVIYNASLRTEAAYMMFFVLALPFLKDESDSPSPVKA